MKEQEFYNSAIHRQEELIKQLLDNGYHADERLARANEIVLKCAEENRRLVTLVDKITEVFSANVDYMHQRESKLIDYILQRHPTIDITNKNAI